MSSENEKVPQTQHLTDVAGQKEQLEREISLIRKKNSAMLETVAQLQGRSDKLRRIEKANIFMLLGRAIEAEMRFRDKARETKKRLKRKLGVSKRSKFKATVAHNSPAAAPNRSEQEYGQKITVRPMPDPDMVEVLDSKRPLMLCVSHVVPWPPRAGNEYRFHRLLCWIRSIGWDVAIVLSPIPGEPLGDDNIASFVAEYDNVILTDRDKVVQYQTNRAALRHAIETLNGVKVRDFAEVLGEKENPSSNHILSLTRAFSPNLLLETIEAIDKNVKPAAVMVNSCFMARGLPLLRKDVIKIVDTYEVFSTKEAKLKRFGISNDLSITFKEERDLLKRADYVLAIQPDEANELRSLGLPGSVVTVGVDMPKPPTVTRIVDEPILLMVGAANDMNTKGLRGFLRFAWPLILRTVPNAELRIVGLVGNILQGHEERVRWLGQVNDLDQAYAEARVIVNPTVVGTGIKIKTLEALSRLRPIVLWPLGLDGVDPELRSYCDCVTDWYGFAQAVCEILSNDEKAGRVAQASERIETILSSKQVYADLARIIHRT